MNELRLRPKNDYLYTAKWEDLFFLAEHWQSDHSFYKDELRFLTHLITKYFILMSKEEKLSDVQQMLTELSKLELQQKVISTNIKKNLTDLGLLIENNFNDDQLKFRKDYLHCENELMTFIEAVKKLKKELFTITEQILKSEKKHHLLTS
jgi:hypothetical protein